jgi:carboxymethylenebutenolidase
MLRQRRSGGLRLPCGFFRRRDIPVSRCRSRVRATGQREFIPKCPADFKLTPISRTVGADRLVDEMLVSFTHDVEIDWMLPGVPPTGKRVEVPTVAIVNFRGDKLYHEHIYWDQASVLVQIGLFNPRGLPVAGVETAKKLVDETRPSNTLMEGWVESAGTPTAVLR